MYFRFIAITLNLLLFFLSLSCHRPSSDNRRLMAHEIYLQNIKLLKQYSDSILLAKDSLAIKNLMIKYDEVLAKLYFSYPPEIDIEMTEAENDTLAQFTLKLLKLRNEQLYKFANPVIAEEDSISPTAITG